MTMCTWCLQEHPHFIDHHYPIPKIQGGKTTVSICANCHGIAHGGLITDMRGARTPQEQTARLHTTQYLVASEYFPGLILAGLPFISPWNPSITLDPREMSSR